VNAAFARLHFPHGDPIGRTFRIDSQPDVDLEIVGVVEDAKYDEPRAAIRPMVFLPLLQMRPNQPVASGEYFSNFITTIEVRTTGDPMAVAPVVRRALAGIDPTLPVLRINTLEDHIEQGLGREQVSATLASVFAVIALTLACIGLYGVMAYLVQRRIAEIGVRMALGATRGVVIAAVMRETLTQARAGRGARDPGVGRRSSDHQQPALWRDRPHSRNTHPRGRRVDRLPRNGRIHSGTPGLTARPSRRSSVELTAGQRPSDVGILLPVLRGVA
jgi:hypothetical protein